MDYEKKYKEAFERAREKYYAGCFVPALLEYIFPELKESEDEEIKNSIIAINEKPADNTNKVERKFYEGDWLVENDTNKLVQIVRYEERSDGTLVWFNNGTGIYTDFLCGYHLWTIEDAKDGDILCTYECDEPKIVFTLKGTPNKHYGLRYYSYYNIMYPHLVPYSDGGCLAPKEEDVKPATKEQRGILLQKLKALEI